MAPSRYFQSIFICLFITIIIFTLAEPIPHEFFSANVQLNAQENGSSLSEPATLSKRRRSGTLLRRTPTFTSLNKRAPQVGSRAARKAAKALTNETNKDLSTIENPNSKTSAIKSAAKDAVKQEKLEDKARSTLSRAAGNTAAVRQANRAVQQNGPKVVGGFQQIVRNPDSKANVQKSVQQINQGRGPVKAANKALIAAGTGRSGGGGGRGGGRRK